MSQAEKNLKNLKTNTSLTGLADVGFVVEAVFENMELKKKIFKELDSIVPPSTILCTNTSTLDIDEIGAVVSDPARTMGMHFFSPANVMKLVENVQSKVSKSESEESGTVHRCHNSSYPSSCRFPPSFAPSLHPSQNSTAYQRSDDQRRHSAHKEDW